MDRIVQRLIDGVLEVLCLILLTVAVGVLFPIAVVFKCFRVAFRVANISILADYIVKLRTIVYNKANTKIKKNQ